MQKVGPRSKLRFPALYLQQLTIPHVKHGLSARWLGYRRNPDGPQTKAASRPGGAPGSLGGEAGERGSNHERKGTSPIGALTARVDSKRGANDPCLPSSVAHQASSHWSLAGASRGCDGRRQARLALRRLPALHLANPAPGGPEPQDPRAAAARLERFADRGGDGPVRPLGLQDPRSLAGMRRPMKLQTAQQLREDEVRKQVALIRMRMESATPKFSRHHRGRSGKMCQANGHN